MEAKEIQKQLRLLESKSNYDVDVHNMVATLNVNDFIFYIDGQQYIINGTITREVTAYCPATWDYPEDYEYSDVIEFAGELGIYDKDGEEIYYDELNIKL